MGEGRETGDAGRWRMDPREIAGDGARVRSFYVDVRLDKKMYEETKVLLA